MKFGSFILPLFVAGMLSAQTPAPAQRHATGDHNHQGMLQKLTSDLNLTADQQATAKTIFQQSREQAKALQPKLREERSALLGAVKSDNEAQIDKIIQQNSRLRTQAAEIHAKAMAKFYAILNPDQKAKMDQKLSFFMRPGGAARRAPSRG